MFVIADLLGCKTFGKHAHVHQKIEEASKGFDSKGSVCSRTLVVTELAAMTLTILRGVLVVF